MSWCFRSMWFWCVWPVWWACRFSLFLCVRERMTCGKRCVATNVDVDVYAYTWFFSVCCCNNRAAVSATLWSCKEYLSIHRVELNVCMKNTLTLKIQSQVKSNFIASYVVVSFHFHFKAVINGFGLISLTHKCAVCQCDLITRVLYSLV